MTRTSLLSFATLMMITSSAVLIPEQASSADLQLRPKPVVRHDEPSDWRTRLFEQFQRYQQQKNQ
jgi:hypothetical protein